MHLIINADGASRGNPGPSAIGVIIKTPDNTKLVELSRFIGLGTNNEAEYIAVLHAIKEAKKLGATSITLFLDSELIVRQLQGIYKVKSVNLKKYYREITSLLGDFKAVSIQHVQRSLNSEADSLANKALDSNSPE